MKLLEKFRELDFNTKVIYSVAGVITLVIVFGFLVNFVKSFQSVPEPQQTLPSATSTPTPSTPPTGNWEVPEPEQTTDPDGTTFYDMKIDDKDLATLMQLAPKALVAICNSTAGQDMEEYKKNFSQYLAPAFAADFGVPDYSQSYAWQTCFAIGTTYKGYNEEFQYVKMTVTAVKKNAPIEQKDLPKDQQTVSDETIQRSYIFQKIENEWKIVKILSEL